MVLAPFAETLIYSLFYVSSISGPLQILAGASPLEAVRLQIIVMYMLVGAATFTGLIAAWLTYRQFFTPVQQLALE